MNGTQLDERKFYFLLLTWGLCLVLFLWSLGEILGPFVLFLVLIYLLSPFYGTKTYGRITVALGFLTALWLVWTAGWILTPFVLALVLAYILNPLVNRAQGEGLGRTMATAVVLVTFLLVLIVAIAVLGPLFVDQVGSFVSRVPDLVRGALDWLQRLVDRISHIPLPGVGRPEVGQVLDIDTSDLTDFITSQQDAIRRYLVSGAAGVGKGIGVALTVTSYLLVTPIVTFFLLRDFDRIVEAVARLVPVQRRVGIYAFFRDFDVLLGKFLRSQLLVALIVGVIIGLGFFVVGDPFRPYALLLGVIAGVFNIVPYLGFVLTIVPTLLIALVSGNVLVDLLKVAIVLGVEQVLENLISPRIVGKSVGLHPVWVMLSIVVFSFFFGPIGLLIGVPAAVGIKLMLGNLGRAYEASTYYQGPAPVVTPEGVVLGRASPGGSEPAAAREVKA